MLVSRLVTMIFTVIGTCLFSTSSIAGRHYGKGEESRKTRQSRKLKEDWEFNKKMSEEERQFKIMSVSSLEEGIFNLERQLEVYQERLNQVKEEQTLAKKMKEGQVEKKIEELKKKLIRAKNELKGLKEEK